MPDCPVYSLLYIMIPRRFRLTNLFFWNKIAFRRIVEMVAAFPTCAVLLCDFSATRKTCMVANCHKFKPRFPFSCLEAPMMKKISPKTLSRCGMIAALYTVISIVLLPGGDSTRSPSTSVQASSQVPTISIVAPPVRFS